MNARTNLVPAWLDDDRRPLDWNGPVDRRFTPFREADLNRPIIEHFEGLARRHRDRIAIRDADGAMTLGELWDGLSGLAETLSSQTRPGELIGILLPACPLFPLAMLASLAAARPFVVLDTHAPTEWLDHVLQDARPTMVVTVEDGFDDIEARMPTIRVIRLANPPPPAHKNWRFARLGVDEPACVLLTSGSTGRPKSIVNSQRNLLQRVAQSINAAHINTADRLLTLASPSTIVAVRDVMTALLAGASIHLLDPQGVGAREILNVMRAEATTILFVFPALLRSVVAPHTTSAGTSLRLVRIGGDTTLWGDIETLRSWLQPTGRIQVIYAATEAPMMQWFVTDACRREDARVPIGYPLPGNRLAIVDEHGRATPRGEVGELLVASPYVSLGHWADGHCVAEEAGMHRRRASRLFQTGDLVRQRPDGLLERVGRKDRQVKIRGSRVDLDGVEAMLRGHRFVRDVAALARRSSTDGSITLVAYVSPHAEAPASLIDDLRMWMFSAPPSMRPVRFYLADAIPRLPSSKLDVRALAALDGANVQNERAELAEEAEPAVEPSDRVGRTVARAWQQVLLVPVHGPQDDFFDSGGDSLKAITFVMELERALGLELSLTLINEAPRFGQLCEALRNYRTPRSTPLITLKAGDGAPPLFFIHGVGGNVVEFLPAARRLTYPGAVIGIRARGAVPGEAVHTRVEAMAEDYLREIREYQPRGPYCLCGYSFGGLVAFEVARRLAQSGEELRLVGLFDTLTSPVRWPLRQSLAFVGRRIVELVRHLRGTTSAPPLNLRVSAGALLASARYRPGFYPGHVTLFVPAWREPGLPSLDGTWCKHVRSLAVVETAGTHATMLSGSDAESTAAILTSALSGAVVEDRELARF